MKQEKSMKWLLLVSGILVLLIGVVMIFTPFSDLVGLALFIGVAMFVSGISEIITFFSEGIGYHSGWVMASGILSTLLGGWILFGRGSSALIATLPYVFAVWMIAEGIMSIAGAFTVKSVGSSMWGWMLVVGILVTILGFMLLLDPLTSTLYISYLLAFMVISYGINNIVMFFNLKKIEKYDSM